MGHYFCHWWLRWAGEDGIIVKLEDFRYWLGLDLLFDCVGSELVVVDRGMINDAVLWLSEPIMIENGLQPG